MHTAARLVLAASLFIAAASVAFTSQGDPLKDAATLGRTRDDAQFEAFNKSYSLTLSGNIERAEIVTEFRRAVLIAHQRARTIGPYHAAVLADVAFFAGIAADLAGLRALRIGEIGSKIVRMGDVAKRFRE